MLRAGVSREDAKSQSLVGARRLARESRECRQSPSDMIIPSPPLPDRCRALLATFNFLPTNPG